MNRAFSRFVAMGSLPIAALAGAGVASAATISKTVTETHTFTAFNGASSQTVTLFPGSPTATFGPFNPAIGTLESVDVTWRFTTSFNVTDDSDSGGALTGGWSGSEYINSYEYSSAGNGLGNGGGPGASYSSSNYSSDEETFSAESRAAEFPIFYGADAFTTTFATGATTLDAGHIASGTATATAMVTVEYNFAPVPEPAAWALMLIGVGAVGGALRARRGSYTKVA
jgi:hypothetical protein